MTLKDIPVNFDIDSEEEVRFAVSNYFKELGFQLDELSFEDHFTIQLGRGRFTAENGYRKGRADLKRAEGYSDLLLVRDGKPLAIVEVKRQEHDLNDDDAWQAISYARLLRRQIAPYAIVTNGKDTRVYDPLTDSDSLVEISDPKDSRWSLSGQSFLSISDDLKYEATRKIIGLNVNTLHSFCENQVIANLDELDGTVNENKVYVPELYVPRQYLEREFLAWMGSDLPCFAVIGESGVGKSNFMCAKVKEQVNHHFVLFYSAQYLSGSLKTAIENDFVWEFKRQSNIAQIVDRFDEIASKHNKNLIIFVDALDEFTGNQDDLKAELREFSGQLIDTSVRLCVSCKTYDWERYVIHDGETYSRFAKNVYPKRPPVHDPQQLEPPNPRNVGVWLVKFSSAELDDAYNKYSEVFSIEGTLEGELRSECELPLMLRLTSETFAGQTDLPSKISSKRLFDSYKEKKLVKVSNRVTSELILSAFAKLLVERNVRHVSARILGQEIGISQFDENSYHELVRLGLLRRSIDKNGTDTLSFGFEKLRSYIFTTISCSWLNKSDSEIAAEICELFRKPNQLIIEAVDFYLTVIDQGETELLIEVALSDLWLFLGILNIGYNSASLEISLQSSDVEEFSPKRFERIRQYAKTYSIISRRYFPNFCSKIVPYTNDPVGIWMDESGEIFQFRSITTEYPRTVVSVPREKVNGAFKVSISAHQRPLLGNPEGPIHHFESSKLSKHLPQKVAWEQIVKQIAILFEKGALNEFNTPDIMQERIRELLFFRPNTWFGGIDERLTNYQKLGLKSKQAAYELSIRELYQRVSEPLENHFQEINTFTLEDLDSKTSLSPRKRWHTQQIGYLLSLQHYLEALESFQENVEPPVFQMEEIFKSIRNPEAAAPIFEKLISKIFKAYRQMVEHNFGSIADWLMLYKFEHQPILIEITNSPLSGSDYLDVRYILLSTTELPQNYIIDAHGRQSYLVDEGLDNPKTFRHQELKSFGGNFGEASIAVEVGNQVVNEEKAFVYRTRFPSNNLISDQVYQLISAEIKCLLGGNHMNWPIDDLPKIDYQHLAKLIIYEKNSNDPHDMTLFFS